MLLEIRRVKALRVRYFPTIETVRILKLGKNARFKELRRFYPVYNMKIIKIVRIVGGYNPGAPRDFVASEICTANRHGKRLYSG